MAKQTDKCSFCGRNRSQVGLLITGFTGNICEDCAQQASQIVKDTLGAQKNKNAGSYY